MSNVDFQVANRKSKIRLLSFQDYEVIVSFAFSDNRELTAVNEDFSGSASRVVVTAHSKAVGACRKDREQITDESAEKVRDDQLAAMKEIRTSLKWDIDRLQSKSRELFGSDVMGLNPVMADALIAYLKQQGNGDGQPESRI